MKYNFLGSFLFFLDVEVLQALFNIFLIYSYVAFSYGFTAMVKNVHQIFNAAALFIVPVAKRFSHGVSANVISIALLTSLYKKSVDLSSRYMVAMFPARE